jgi:hypothetical protein
MSHLALGRLFDRFMISVVEYDGCSFQPSRADCLASLAIDFARRYTPSRVDENAGRNLTSQMDFSRVTSRAFTTTGGS